MANAASSVPSRYCCCCYFFFFCSFFLPSALHCQSLDESATFAFSFDGFEKTASFDSEMTLYGDAEILDSAVRLAGEGRLVSRKIIRFFGARPGFSTYFSFSPSPGDGGSGPAFFLAPSVAYAEPVQGNQTGNLPSAIDVGFLTVTSRGSGNASRNLVRIRVGSEVLAGSKDLSRADLVLDGGKNKLHSWIDYDGDSKRMEVRLSVSKELRPSNSSISYGIDLSSILWREPMLVGVSTSNANSTKSCSIYSWNFTVKHGKPYLMHSEPLDPNSFMVRPHETPPDHPAKSDTPVITTGMLFAAACGALVTCFIMLLWFAVISRRPITFIDYPMHPVDVVYEKIVVVGNKVKRGP